MSVENNLRKALGDSAGDPSVAQAIREAASWVDSTANGATIRELLNYAVASIQRQISWTNRDPDRFSIAEDVYLHKRRLLEDGVPKEAMERLLAEMESLL